jgi:ribosome biogenesis GTPase
MNLADYGLTPALSFEFASTFDKQQLVPARVVRVDKHRYTVVSAGGQNIAEISGRLLHESAPADLPVIGDWVAIERAGEHDAVRIHGVLHRQTVLSRKAPVSGKSYPGQGKTEEQVLAANVDIVFVVTGLDHDFNPRRIERYVTVVFDSGAIPVVLLNKADLREDAESISAEIESNLMGVSVHLLSAATGDGIDRITDHIQPGKTVILVGSSGAGKSTIINRLLGRDHMRTQEVRGDDSRGRHTTTHRELIQLPTGGLIIDTPGLREIGLWDDGEGLSRTFEDIESIASQCRFNDCRHESEPGCAIKQALDDGSLDESRYQSYLKLQKEQAFMRRRKDIAAIRRERREWDKKIARYHADIKRAKKEGLL